MKMRKVMSLILGVVMAASMATVSYAATPVVESENPVISVDVINATASVAKFNVNFKLDADDLRAFEEVEDEETLEVKYYGKGIKQLEVQLGLNAAYFDAAATNSKGSGGYNSVSVTKKSEPANHFNYAFVATNDGALIVENEFVAFAVTAALSDDMKAKYQELLEANNNDTAATKAAMIAELNAKTDLVAYDYANVAVIAYPADGADSSGEAAYQYYTKYRSDGNGDFKPTLKAGADAPAPVDPTVTVDNDNAVVEEGEKADAKTWAVAVDGGYVKAGDVLVATLTKGDDTQVVNLTVGNDVVGGADWAFNLKVRFKDAANRALTTLAVAKAAN